MLELEAKLIKTKIKTYKNYAKLFNLKISN
jgi:hypothetical protein